MLILLREVGAGILSWHQEHLEWATKAAVKAVPGRGGDGEV